MNGLLLHLSGPLQSWGTQSPWNNRDTHTHPTHSGLIGLLAAAAGDHRGAPLDKYTPIEFTIRIDRPGQPIVDYQTVGGGRPREHTPPLAGGGRRPAGRGTIVSHRHYLSDAAFTVAITGASPTLLDTLTEALTHPVYTPYLGRRSCPPTAPLFLGRHHDPVTALHQTVPLARDKPNTGDHVTVDFITEHPDPNAAHTHTTPTHPHIFGPHRTYRQHDTWRTPHELPTALCGGHGTHYLIALQQVNENSDAP
ncbi:type I-E CRISPR-associated protein Cas5/CasD [Kibdelosporangium phytohabitans]|uniref:CRISPR-associated protein Cas5 n=1 Tax=Kibdelosporangium phytohabitans TaxID=860235 RepID=A0A0N9HU97_9PSEU|nr:type I-E CRISPR-associated protein Cas5/CasD [Kibdelosporangium phytohabitans]ALG06955.1 hypothetical protein AOZ06_08480 [Kibdelosporangium phytohabitans]MBE1468231.1 CRISPR system Cascade subunit CasD [Kibdelosporangium phytohabitans]